MKLPAQMMQVRMANAKPMYTVLFWVDLAISRCAVPFNLISPRHAEFISASPSIFLSTPGDPESSSG
jgi:hypothetical protein